MARALKPRAAQTFFFEEVKDRSPARRTTDAALDERASEPLGKRQEMRCPRLTDSYRYPMIFSERLLRHTPQFSFGASDCCALARLLAERPEKSLRKHILLNG